MLLVHKYPAKESRKRNQEFMYCMTIKTSNSSFLTQDVGLEHWTSGSFVAA